MQDFKLILKKELKDILRDKRSFIMLFVPVLLFPMMFILMGSQLPDEDSEEKIPCIVEVGESESDQALYQNLFEDWVTQREIERSETEDLKRGAVYLSISIQDGNILLKYNEASTKSTAAADTIYKALNEARESAANEILQTQYGVDPDDLQPFTVEQQSISPDGEAGSSAMASIAPMMLVMLIMSGGVSVAVDLFTGEKERGTLESLMTTQVSRRSILMAKFAATLCISLLGMALSILAYIVSFKFSKAARRMLTGGAQVDFKAAQILTVLVVCLALSVFAVSLMTLLGLHAKTVKEAQSQMSLMTILPTLLGGLTLFMDTADIGDGAMWIPVFNAMSSIKMVFLGTAEAKHIIFTAVSLFVYSALMWLASTRMLHSEKLLQG